MALAHPQSLNKYFNLHTTSNIVTFQIHENIVCACWIVLLSLLLLAPPPCVACQPIFQVENNIVYVVHFSDAKKIYWQ